MVPSLCRVAVARSEDESARTRMPWRWRWDDMVREVVMKADGRISRGTVDTIVGEHR